MTLDERDRFVKLQNKTDRELIDKLQMKIREINKDMKLHSVTWYDNRLVSAQVDIPIAGNRELISALVGIGFRKVRRHKREYGLYKSYAGYPMYQLLEYRFDKQDA